MMDFVQWPTRTGYTGLITVYLAELSDRYYSDSSCQIPIHQSKPQSSKYSFLNSRVSNSRLDRTAGDAAAPRKSELKKRAKALEKEKKATEKAAKLQEQAAAQAAAEDVCRLAPLRVFLMLLLGLC